MNRLLQLPMHHFTLAIFACLILGMTACDQPAEPNEASSLNNVDSVDSQNDAIALLDDDVEDKPDGEAQQSNEADNSPTSGLKLMQIQIVAEKAVAASKSGKHALAVTFIDELLRRDPENTRVMLRKADNQFMAFEIEEAIKTYDRLIEIAPGIEPQLWQRGLALYYAERYKDGVEQFEKHWVVNRQDVENSVWHMLCGARATSVDEARKKLIDIQQDTRIPMKQILQLFAGEGTPEDVLEAARQPIDNPFMAKMNVYYGHLYLGLYYEMIGDEKKSLESMKLAQQTSILEQNHLMSQVANIHLKMRESKEEVGAWQGTEESSPAQEQGQEK